MNNLLMETLVSVIDVLKQEGALYAVTGSVASSVHGEPFVSQDVDLILVALPQTAAAIAKGLPACFYAPEDMLSTAAKELTLANVIDNRTGLKVDLSFVRNDGFFRDVFDRRVETRIGSDGPTVCLVSAEDVILMKLLWRKDTRSSKQWDNALGVVRVKGASLDWAYLTKQATALDLEEDLIRLRDEAEV